MLDDPWIHMDRSLIDTGRSVNNTTTLLTPSAESSEHCCSTWFLDPENDLIPHKNLYAHTAKDVCVHNHRVDRNGYGKWSVADRMSDISPGKAALVRPRRPTRADISRERRTPDDRPRSAISPAAAHTVTAVIDVGTAPFGVAISGTRA